MSVTARIANRIARIVSAPLRWEFAIAIGLRVSLILRSRWLNRHLSDLTGNIIRRFQKRETADATLVRRKFAFDRTYAAGAAQPRDRRRSGYRSWQDRRTRPCVFRQGPNRC